MLSVAMAMLIRLNTAEDYNKQPMPFLVQPDWRIAVDHVLLQRPSKFAGEEITL